MYCLRQRHTPLISALLKQKQVELSLRVKVSPAYVLSFRPANTIVRPHLNTNKKSQKLDFLLFLEKTNKQNKSENLMVVGLSPHIGLVG